MSLIEAPCFARRDVIPLMPPGLSLTVETNRKSLPSAASPRSITRPSTVMSIFPPQRGRTTFLPFRSGHSFCNNAANPVAPPPSTTHFSISVSLSTAKAMLCSSTHITLSTRSRAVSNALSPILGTARPSANVAPAVPSTTLPALSESVYDAQSFGSTPITCTSGLSVFMTTAMPAISPAPPTGTTMASRSGTCSNASQPTVPAPAII
mmetsp:Transcript_25236/g.60728  ORF Transcript_25236/g.60728 Transcript_25236/m.60728 type:complete len:208 (+) Transcript_25236:567-1190(+)